jgi:signal transduction histidine kinase
MRWSQIGSAIFRLSVCAAAVLAVTMAVYAISTTLWGLRYAVFVSFLAPLGFYMSDSRDIFAVAALLVSGILTSYLSDRARKETLSANERRAEELQQVLMNLLLNSVDAMKVVDCTRELSVSSQREGRDHLLVAVSDTGIGLPPEMGRIFDAFFTTKPHGTGMGLAISRTIIESHGGRLWAIANSGHGAIFYFTLPTSREARR